MNAVMEKRTVHNVGIRIPDEVYAPLARIAAEQDRSLNAQIVRCLRECVQRELAAGGPGGTEPGGTLARHRPGG